VLYHKPSLRILAHGLHRQARGLLQHAERLRLHPIQPAAIRAHPKAALAFHAQRKHHVVRQSLLRRNLPRLAFLIEPEHAIAQSAHDQMALMIFTRGPDRRARLPRIRSPIAIQMIRRPLLNAAIRQPPITDPFAREQVIQLGHRQHILHWQRLGIRRHFRPQREQTLVRPHPHQTRLLRRQRPAIAGRSLPAFQTSVFPF